MIPKTLKFKSVIWAWLCTPGIPSLRQVTWEDVEFEASLGHIVRVHLKKMKKKSEMVSSIFQG
jgi:hypothetical protein